MGRARAVLRGREAALAALRAAFGDSALRGRLVLVRGRAGIGKSTLLDASVASGRSAGALEGGCPRVMNLLAQQGRKAEETTS